MWGFCFLEPFQASFNTNAHLCHPHPMEIFFYGLFMDAKILSENGIQASNPRKGYLENYTLKIGNRASLIPSENERAYGILMTIADTAIHALYAEPSVADYIPEDVIVVVSYSNKQVPAICYNLPDDLLDGANANYAKALYKLAKKVGFPEEYLVKIAGMMRD